jgi:transposase
MMVKKDWLKLHCCIGVNTHVITALEITDRTSNDMNHFIPVLEATRKNFNVEKVMADKAYSSMHHFAYTELNGIDAYIPFRDNAKGVSRNSTAIWERMYHYFNLNREEFLQNYGRRENVESAFHSLKSKFGSSLKSKSPTALKNEALCIVIGYNLTRVIHAMNEFGISPEFFEIAS